MKDAGKRTDAARDAGSVTVDMKLDERSSRCTLLESRRGVERQQLSAVDDGNAFAEPVGLLHVVRRHDDGATLPMQIA